VIDEGEGFGADLRRLYPDLDADLFARIGAEFGRIEVEGGSVLVREGEPSDALYILLSGRLAVTRAGPGGRPARIGEIGRGEMIGEMSLLGEGRRTATVTAMRDSRLIRISNQAFIEFMQRHPSVTRQFIQILIARLSRRGRRPDERISTLALLPLDCGATPRGFAADFALALQRDGGALVVDRVCVEQRFPGCFDAADQAGVAAWLNDQEQRHGLVVYLADPEPGIWTRLCLRQADRVLLLGDAAAPPSLGAARSLLPDDAGALELRGVELVLLHRRGIAPSGTAAWLRLRRLRRHHHVALGDGAAMARLMRHVRGRSVALALGGGGARAFAEIGVLRALEESGIAVDVIGGTSMGAVIGALAAAGMDARALQASLGRALRHKPFSGLTLPLVSLLSGRRLGAMMDELFGDAAIEDLWRRYFCVSCNLTRGTLEVSESGALGRWVRASNSVPGIVPPLVAGGELFVDGGLINNVPADLAVERNAGPVIAVNVSGNTLLTTDLPDGADLSGWRLLASGAAMPRFSRILVRSMLLASATHADSVRPLAALHLAPELPGVDVGDWHALDALVEAGYAHAMKALDTWHPGAAT
jgi:NTE family protein